MTTRVRVAVRARPLVEKEIGEGCESCVTILEENQVLLGKVSFFLLDMTVGDALFVYSISYLSEVLIICAALKVLPHVAM